MIRTEITAKDFCSACGQEIPSFEAFTLHRRRHFLEAVASTPEGRRVLDDLRAAGFVDKPDPWNLPRT